MVDFADDASSGTAHKFLSREAPSDTRPSYSNHLETFGSITPRIEVATGGLHYCSCELNGRVLLVLFLLVSLSLSILPGNPFIVRTENGREYRLVGLHWSMAIVSTSER